MFSIKNFFKRHPKTNFLLLTQRNVYILPTRAGWVFGCTMFALLAGSVNYQLNLGYALTFLLAGSAIVSLYNTHQNLSGLQATLKAPMGVFCGEEMAVEIRLENTSGQRRRWGIGARFASRAKEGTAWLNLTEGVPISGVLRLRVDRRGLYPLEPLRIETRFPFGLFCAWSTWRPDTHVVVYPPMEAMAPPLPEQRDVGKRTDPRRKVAQDQTQGIRGYRHGDLIKHVLWKKSAHQIEVGGNLITKETLSEQEPATLWLAWDQCQGLEQEKRLSRLVAWVVAAEPLDGLYGLRLPGVELRPSRGYAHRHQCLEALALWGQS